MQGQAHFGRSLLRTRWGATSGASLGFPRMDFPTRFLQMFLNCQVQVFLNCQVQMFVLLELLGLFYRQADAKTQCWMQQINTENTQQVGKWIFRKMAKSALAFYKRCKMDLLKSRTKLCGFQALLRYEDDSCNEFEEKKSMRQNYGQSIAPLWRQTKSVHKETDVLNMNFQRFLRTIFKILKMTLKMKTEFSKMLFWKCDFSWKWKNANFVAKIGVYSRERREFAKNACLPLCDAFLQSPT